jgi:PBP1b-binding outer membrane lipoprotein LpoB
LENPAEILGGYESILMKIHHFALGLVAVSALFFSGCASETATETTQTQTDPSKRVHTQEELRKSGETNPAAALEKTDPSVMSGPR